ncbi:MAG: hypothetical protein JO268_13550 [Pseudonocardiales bacterium]|nr:hypothetical protein [Pseudonocardiales bacterium]
MDGYRTHGSWVAFQADRTRQNVPVKHGCTILRYTAHDVRTLLEPILDEIAEALAHPLNRAPASAEPTGPRAAGSLSRLPPRSRGPPAPPRAR